MDRDRTLRVVVAVIICCGLLSVDDVAALPQHACSSLINHVDSLIVAAQPVPVDDLPLYLACLGVERQPLSADDPVRQLLSLQPNTASADDTPTAESGSATVCATVECLGLRAALTFEPCSRLTQTQCSALVLVLENIISVDSDVDDDVAAARLLDHFRQFAAHYRKWRQSRVTVDGTRLKRHADTTGNGENNKSDRDTGTVLKYGENDKNIRMTSSRVTSGTGAVRMRRSTVPRDIPFQVPERMTPETRQIVESYLEWRQKNGYGRVSGRWG